MLTAWEKMQSFLRSEMETEMDKAIIANMCFSHKINGYTEQVLHNWRQFHQTHFLW